MRELLKKLILLIREDSIRKVAHGIALFVIAIGLVWLTYTLLIESNEKDLNEPMLKETSPYTSSFTTDQASFDPEILESNRKAWTSSRKQSSARFRDFVYTMFFHPVLVFFFAIIINVIVLGSIIVYYITKQRAKT